MKPYQNFFKRVIDIAASGCGLLVLSPVLAAVTVWLHFANKGAGLEDSYYVGWYCYDLKL